VDMYTHVCTPARPPPMQANYVPSTHIHAAYTCALPRVRTHAYARSVLHMYNLSCAHTHTHTCSCFAALQVWEEGCSSEAGAVRLYAAEIVALLVEGLGSQQWGKKQAAAQAVVRLTEVRVGGRGGCAAVGQGAGRSASDRGKWEVLRYEIFEAVGQEAGNCAGCVVRLPTCCTEVSLAH